MEIDIKNNIIKLKKGPNDLDRFVLDFISILDTLKINYILISGYVSILLGRARATEDIDIFIEKLPKGKVSKLYNKLVEKGFWCLNTDDIEEIFSYLEDGLAVRFALKDETIPNMEVKFPKTRLEEESLKDYIIVKIGDKELRISSLERQIAFKRYYLKSDKDIEDAEHIEHLFKEHIDNNKVYKYKRLIEKHG